MLLEKLKNEQLAARKNKEAVAVSLLTTLYSEAVNVGKNDGNRQTTDDEVISVVKKFIKSAMENKEIYTKSSNLEKLSLITQELVLLQEYLPETVSDEKIKLATLKIIADLSLPKNSASMGRIMKELKSQFGSSLDGGVASKLIKELLSS